MINLSSKKFLFALENITEIYNWSKCVEQLLHIAHQQCNHQQLNAKPGSENTKRCKDCKNLKKSIALMVYSKSDREAMFMKLQQNLNNVNTTQLVNLSREISQGCNCK